jgi:Nucleoid-associated protein
MKGNFVVERIALHLVDRQLSCPRFSPHEVDLAAFTRLDDLEAIESFFFGHLTEVWTASEGSRTRAATFGQMADMRHYYDELTHDISQFFLRSCTMAQRLYDVSHGLRTSPGLLMILWVRKTGDPRPFLTLFKMDPGRTDKITLRIDAAGEILLDLAVHHIEQTLPDTSDRVLKWAVIPHPTRHTFDVKVKDKEGGADLAQYFMTFLGCEARSTEKQQVQSLLEALPAYAQDYHAHEDWETGVREVIKELESAPIITPEVVTKKVQELNVFEGFQVEAFRSTLANFKAADLDISPKVLRATKIEYELPSGILIRGPIAAMESFVKPIPQNGDIEFRIRTPSYDKRYV